MRRDLPSLGYNAVFIDAPHVLEPVDLTGHGITLDTLGASEASAASEDSALKPRAWYKTDPTRTRTDGLEESLAYLRDTLRTQRFEVRQSKGGKDGDNPNQPMLRLRLNFFSLSPCFVGCFRFQVSGLRAMRALQILGSILLRLTI